MLSDDEWTLLGRKMKLTAREIEVLRGGGGALVIFTSSGWVVSDDETHK